MTRYLVAADADQIQTFLFRSSHLREVIGGSRLLANFFDQIKSVYSTNAIISGGGSFRLDFDNQRQAEEFIEEQADFFRQRTGGTMTVAGPEPYEENNFQEVNKNLQRKLMETKLSRPGFEAALHMPPIAFCTSCGVELATAHLSPTPELPIDLQERATYLCDYCQSKAEYRSNELNSFYDDFRSALRENLKLRSWNFPGDPSDELGKLDTTRYVAYLIADGNGMGRLFDKQSTRKELQDLSERLEKAMWTSLAEPVKDLIQRLEDAEKFKGWCPIVPLIVGGDDLFALIPSRYALDIAKRVSETFEKQMDSQATLGVAVVICQSHYPYMLAHEHGEKILKEAKRLGKALGGVSAITFDVIVGNELWQQQNEKTVYRAGLKPYFSGAFAGGQDQAGLTLSTLLDARLEINKLPGKRKSELRALFDLSQVSELDQEQNRKNWEQKLNTLRKRLEQEMRISLDHVLSSLGREGAKTTREIWRSVERPFETDQFFAHGLPDLIEVWDYSYRLDLPDMVYQWEEE